MKGDIHGSSGVLLNAFVDNFKRNLHATLMAAAQKEADSLVDAAAAELGPQIVMWYKEASKRMVIEVQVKR